MANEPSFNRYQTQNVEDLFNVSSQDIDNILNELDDNEQKTTHSTAIDDNKNENELENDLTWPQITEAIGKGDIGFIKKIITSNDININAKNPENGRSLLIYAVIIGNSDLVNVACNFGADVHLKDNDDMDALDYATKYGQYKITELLYYRQLSGSLGSDMKNVAKKIHTMDKQAKLMMEFKHGKVLMNAIIEYAIHALEEKNSFSQGIL